MSGFEFGDLSPWFGAGLVEEGGVDEKAKADAFAGFLAAKAKAFDALDSGGGEHALGQAQALVSADQPALRDAFERDIGRLREAYVPQTPDPILPSPLEDLLGRYAAIPARSPDHADWAQRRADRLVGTAQRLKLIDAPQADALMNRFGADAAEHLALGSARRGGARPVLAALADRSLFPDLKGARRRRLRSRLQARLLGEGDDSTFARDDGESTARLGRLAAAYARAAALVAGSQPAAEIEDAAAINAITPGLRRLLRGVVAQRRTVARQNARRIARVEAALDAGTPLDRADPEDRAAADAHYEAVRPAWRGLEPKARLALVLPYVKALGLLPKGLVRAFATSLRTGTPEDKHAAAALIGDIAELMPDALAELRPGAVVQAGAINALTELGYGPERAVERAGAILAGANGKPDPNDDDDRAAIVERLRAVMDRVAELQGVENDTAWPNAPDPAAAGAFADPRQRSTQPRFFDASAVPIPAPGPLGALLAALTLMMILIEEQRRRSRPLHTQPPQDEPSDQERERRRAQNRPPPPGHNRPPEDPPPRLPPVPPPPISADDTRREDTLPELSPTVPLRPTAERANEGGEVVGLSPAARRVLRRFPAERHEAILREFIGAGRIGDVTDYTVNIEIGGGMEAANADFERIVRAFGGDPTRAQLDVRAYPPTGVRWYQFPDGTTINVRPSSSSGRPTVEITSNRGSIARRY